MATKQETKTEATQDKAPADGTASSLNEDGTISEPMKKPTAQTVKADDGTERIVAPVYNTGWTPAGKEPTEQEKRSYERYQERKEAQKKARSKEKS